MKAVRATYSKGKIRFSEKPTTSGPVEVLVVFPDGSDDPWDEILSEATPRPSFVKFADECRKQIAAGKAKPLDLDQL